MTRKCLYVISDLHLGGAPAAGEDPGFQMCPPEMRDRLARFIDWIARPRADGADLELVINGDFVDFLAEPDQVRDGVPVFSALRTDPALALATFRALVRNIDGEPSHYDGDPPRKDGVFAALKRFVAAGHKLTLTLGNHDVELALPPVRRALVELLTGGAPARVEFLLNGEAYAVGPVLVEHGNRCDGWNAVQHDKLRALCSRMSRGETYPSFAPQPGSRLVAEVMNPLKRRYRFIDLLKPETQAVIPLLAALEPASIVKLGAISRAATEYLRAESVDLRRQHETSGYVSAFESLGDAPTPPPPRDRDEAETLQLLAEAEATWASPAGGLDSLRGGEVSTLGDWLGAANSLWRVLGKHFDKAFDQARLGALRTAFLKRRETLHATFDLLTEDPRYEGAAKELAKDCLRVVMFGHTHLAKSIPLHEHAHYLNAGTWCPTMALDESWYDPKTSDDKSLPELAAFLKDLAANNLGPRLRRKAHCARVEFDLTNTGGLSGDVVASLCECGEDGEPSVVSERRLSR